MHRLRSLLQKIDGRGYKAYKEIRGSYEFDGYRLHIDHVQGDPFASPSKIRLEVPKSRTVLKGEWETTSQRKVRLEDTITRSVAISIHEQDKRASGSGKSGLIAIDEPSQEVLERTSVQLSATSIFICLTIGLPAKGRTVLGRQAEKIFNAILPEIVRDSIFSLKEAALLKAIQLCDQQDAIRAFLEKEGLVAFIANGSVLPRESGVSDHPLKSGDVVPFQSPHSLEVSIKIPHRQDSITGMAITEGITLIVGGGYHGKSTVLESIERGVYDHIEGDGREFVLTNETAMKVRAEDGRKITSVNISPFIKNLPFGKTTDRFTSEDASGSTSQAATIIESLEAGTEVLLIDEDTSATNFMIRDQRMQQLVSKDREPITPFIDKVKQLYSEHAVSTLLVMGGSGDYFDVADTVVLMDQYRPYDVTSKAKEIAQSTATGRREEGGERFGDHECRMPSPASLNSRKGKRSKVAARGLKTIQYGMTDIKLDYVEQLTDPSQTRGIAEILHFIEKKNWLGTMTFSELLEKVEKQIHEQGLASFTDFPNAHPGDLARPRMLELASAINRLRTLKINDR
ncbi:ABC-ATPase domain-containing protein [Alkalihalobacillus sp. AL-G]|uniref:ABC-ATPase domain-containing protein n=1 Tax=Alkalihalobacillus sp. AL-G TaxID=2926399 RepID=UPI00272B02C8|nr:ABC-ATPase domain-containing protein [Alkalihalobacillus sp. AL-G]WLD94005.1 ABC-ATPase domain-containing protein [Alkalihalobacillus sp. AL-G]